MNHKFEDVLNRLKGEARLPALSNNFKILSSLADDNIDFQKLALVISNYPEISARLVALANSAWSAPVKPITNIENACLRLGSSVVKSVCIALIVSYHFNPFRCPGFDVERFWMTSLMVADGAGLLTSNLPRGKVHDELVKTAQTAGLLHNLGLLWLAENCPEETGAAFLMRTAEPFYSLSEALFKCIGTDYSEIGGWLGQQWQFPEVLITVLRQHLVIDYQGEYRELVQLIGMAAAMVASIVNNYDYIPDNDEVEKLGLSLPKQQKAYQQLADNLEKKRELVAFLFR